MGSFDKEVISRPSFGTFIMNDLKRIDCHLRPILSLLVLLTFALCLSSSSFFLQFHIHNKATNFPSHDLCWNAVDGDIHHSSID